MRVYLPADASLPSLSQQARAVEFVWEVIPNNSFALKENTFYDQKNIPQNDNFFVLPRFAHHGFIINSTRNASADLLGVLLYRVECLDYGVVQVKDIRSAADAFDPSVLWNLLCVDNVKIKGLIYLSQVKGLKLQFTNRGQSTVLVTLAQTEMEPGVKEEDFLTRQSTDELFDLHDTSDRSMWAAYQARKKKSVDEVTPVIRICIFIMVGCLLLCVMVRRRELQRNANTRRRIRMNQLPNLDDSEMTINPTSRFDQTKYDGVITKRLASQDFGPFAEKK